MYFNWCLDFLDVISQLSLIPPPLLSSTWHWACWWNSTFKLYFPSPCSILYSYGCRDKKRHMKADFASEAEKTLTSCLILRLLNFLKLWSLLLLAYCGHCQCDDLRIHWVCTHCTFVRPDCQTSFSLLFKICQMLLPCHGIHNQVVYISHYITDSSIKYLFN